MSQPRSPGLPGPFSLRRFLVAVDLTDGAIRTIEYAVALARPVGARLTLLHVIDPAGSGLADRLAQKEWREEARALAEKQLHNFARLFIGRHVPTELAVRIGDPVQQILRAARDSKPDLIILTVPAREPPRHWWQRDPVTRLLRQPDLPLLIRRDREPQLADLAYL